MKSKLLIFSTLALMLLSSCTLQPSPAVPEPTPGEPTHPTEGPKAPTLDIPTNKEFTLTPGQTAKHSPSGSTIRLDSVTSDSRCATGVTCIWQGAATLKFFIKGDFIGSNNEQPLSLSTEAPSIALGGNGGPSYSLELVEVAPYPEQGITIEPRDYRVTLKLVVVQG